MSIFREVEINQDQYRGTSFKEVQLTLARQPVVDVSKDWVNHVNYLATTAKKLASIKPPASIRCTERVIVVDVENGAEHEESVRSSSSQVKPKLLPGMPRTFKQKVIYLIMTQTA